MTAEVNLTTPVMVGMRREREREGGREVAGDSAAGVPSEMGGLVSTVSMYTYMSIYIHIYGIGSKFSTDFEN
ncbi:hypothetical protein RHMOL_Rhmol05G0097900 [Rhododendron molle]|uniref:Uncharacterized protein n=1 Tax=Rhododendron molle TaxID=49168 RepID=A0ACC0NM12_RHOML|nr:hypothetical protein RHMOL_Rhmol05G0097900 [Rhododendron molle]